MDIIYLLIPVSLVVVLLISMLFWWAIKGGQFDDLEGPGFQIMMDDDSDKSEQSAQESQR
ncbi:cbb3-type cytochrome oxidase assembly protein CcoS [Leeia sp. TBRC 13508]|uniref:Cbb3-type cytochrome oxidase assembly protein CcoS n=1 Tax=Leeia speluncae TaxID=2884804 RepID=A0ABS8D9D2_9NEIS|nr:cbb3-type cytochrome oxidase assembly protein CcoS [Leeia speluncae]MCB6184727.1 cbb3-type cytochrome oxidase assembly protein CcoS [Leeia speluncae]